LSEQNLDDAGIIDYEDDMWYSRTKELKEPKSMEVSPPWAGFIFSGIKKKEVRKGGGTWKDVKEGDCLLINERDHEEKLLFKVVSVARYSSLEACLFEEGVENLLPGKKTLQEGIDVYLGFDNPSGIEQRKADFAKYGAIAIELKRA
jgi:ASC-1-like (ASCH) protein